MTAWRVGDRLAHRFNRDLGYGRVVGIEARVLVVEFPDSGATLRLAEDTDAVVRVSLQAGAAVRHEPQGETVIIKDLLGEGRVLLEDGREVLEIELFPLEHGGSLFDRLADGDVDELPAFSARLDALRLAAIREADGLGSFLGGRVLLFPHQLHAAEHATRSDPVRWLLADEVGLGKTVEACLILNHLLRKREAERVLIVAPETLTIQWLGELWRKYHQVFVLLDEARLADVARELGREFNPFEAHSRIVISLELLTERRRLAEQACEAGLDVLVVDEAHRLRRPAGHPGNPEYRAIAPLAARVAHCLLLTATPLEDDAHGFFRLLQLLRPDELPDEMNVEARLAQRTPLPPCTSATRRGQLDGLPARLPVPVAMPEHSGWQPIFDLEQHVRRQPAENPVAERLKADRLVRAFCSGAAALGLLDRNDEAGRRLAVEADAQDPRISWLADHGPDWRARGEKTLVFVAHRETLELLRKEMSQRAQLRTGAFHEDLSPAQRDIEVAQFRLPTGPSMLISTECGGEGRNFQFCHRLVLFDLPWSPAVVEQRIGRLDRIGRDRPVEIVYFRPPAGLAAAVVRLFERIGLFTEPLAGLQLELAHIEDAIRAAALQHTESDDLPGLDALVRESRAALSRIRSAAYMQLHRDPYRSEHAEAILARVPEVLEELTEDVVVALCELLGFIAERLPGERRWSIELGTGARVESLPGVPGGSGFIGTFDRSVAVENESEDFFSPGHALVEGLLAHVDESTLGRVALLHISTGGEPEFGLLALYRRAPAFDVVAVDMQGRRRPEWRDRILRRPLRSRKVNAVSWTSQPGWGPAIRRLAEFLEGSGPPDAVAALRVN